MLACVAIGLISFLVIFPFVKREFGIQDDIIFVLLAYDDQLRALSFWDGLHALWNYRAFRPIDLWASLLIDLETREVHQTIWLHLPGLLAMIGALWVATRKLVVDTALVFPIAVIALALHSSTAFTLWQADTLSQTWCAATGAWLGLALWDGIERARSGRSTHTIVLVMSVLCAVGVLTKETFVGWCAGSLLALGLCYVTTARERSKMPNASWLALAAPLAFFPSAYVYLRTFHSPLAELLRNSDQYAPHLGLNVPYNVSLALAGWFLTGPTHALRDLSSPWLVRATPLLAIVLALGLAVLPWIARRAFGHPEHVLPSWRVLALISLVTFCGCSATFMVSGHINELFLFGPNLAFALLVSIGSVESFRIFALRDRAAPSGALPARSLVLATGLLAAIALFGLGSHAGHSAISWTNASRLWTAVATEQSRLARSDRITPFYLAGDCLLGAGYSLFVVSPADTIRYYDAELLNRKYAGREINFIIGEPQRPLSGEVVFRCEGSIPRPWW